MEPYFGHDLSDEALVALCQQLLPRDSRPFTVLVQRYQHRVLATCFRMMGNSLAAEEQAQEVFIRVYRGIKKFKAQASFSTWLFQIATNTCRTALARRTRQPQLENTSLGYLEHRLPAVGSSEEAAMKLAEQDLVNRALQMLNPDEREILILRETNNLSYKEIAQVQNIGVSAAKMRVMRARMALRQRYLQLTGDTNDTSD